ncbi:hypothetical protein OQZ33_04265 [Pedobacter sp. MC2016-05]|uniref:hypothetical protein n=1 Tax=Pedobacter sp. MC2016-05 TaxID=2994474 RepID=UPI0022451FE1|nr:hypothetical protein [Pedobacter sp. MC2016-05]MCX2473540.1 hypothetical protein [Pedobacter sp. MC2016-05]
MNKTLKKRDLNKIRRTLPPNSKSELAVQSGKSESTVEKVLLGLRKNEQIVQLSLAMCGLPVEIKQELQTKLDS